MTERKNEVKQWLEQNYLTEGEKIARLEQQKEHFEKELQVVNEVLEEMERQEMNDLLDLFADEEEAE